LLNDILVSNFRIGNGIALKKVGVEIIMLDYRCTFNGCPFFLKNLKSKNG